MNVLNKVTKVIAKILEIGHWVGACVFAILFVLTLIPGDTYTTMLSAPDSSIPAEAQIISLYGYEAAAINQDGTPNRTAISLFSIGAALLLVLGAMIIRNVYLIIKTSNGETKFSTGATPFQKDVTRMIREIGIFILGMNVVSFIMALIGGIIVGGDVISSEFNLTTIMVGLLMLCLSQTFAEGEKMKKDVDGLL